MLKPGTPDVSSQAAGTTGRRAGCPLGVKNIHNNGELRGGSSDPATYDAVIVGASLAGCTVAIMLARKGLRIALVERHPDPSAFKRVCTHYIASSAVPTLERLGLLKPMEDIGAQRPRVRVRTPWGWILPPAHSKVPSGINLRRERLDPLIRTAAAETPGVELILGRTAYELVNDDGRVSGVKVRDPNGRSLVLRGRVVVGADGRDSHVAKLANAPAQIAPHRRFSYSGYFEGPPLSGAPAGSIWVTDPQFAAASPTDEGLTVYACMLTKEWLPAFRSDPASALTGFIADLPEAPPIRESRLVGPVIGKLEMPNVVRTPIAPGLALVGDAALATDPLAAVGCGWALQSGEWLADSITAALGGQEPLEQGLRDYSRRHSKRLRPHAHLIHDYATGRRMNRPERLLFTSATHDRRLAGAMEVFLSRNVGPARFMASALPLTIAASARRLISRHAHRGANGADSGRSE